MCEDIFKNGVYKIWFKNKPERVYIGSTSFIRSNSNKTGFYQRRYNHLNSLKRGKHSNKFLQRTYNKYGEDAFQFEIIEICEENIIEREQYWIDFYKSFDRKYGYNLLKIAYSLKGFKKSKEHILKHSNSLKEYFKYNEVHNKKINKDLLEKVKNKYFVRAIQTGNE